MRKAHADDQDRYEDEETCDWARNANIEELSLRGDRLPDANHRAQRTGERAIHRQPERQKVRQRGVDAVVSAREIVTEFMSAEDREHATAVPRSVEQQGSQRERRRRIAELRRVGRVEE